MKKIWKWSLPIVDDLEREIPVGAKILSVQPQRPDSSFAVSLWALCDPDAPMETRSFRFYGTGHSIEGDPGEYIGTVVIAGGAQVYHLFEV